MRLMVVRPFYVSDVSTDIRVVRVVLFVLPLPSLDASVPCLSV